VLAFTNLSFMGTQANFVLKVLIFSAGISVLIKYGGPSLPLAATRVNTLIAVVTPAFVLAITLASRRVIALLGRAKNYQPPD
jgi:hypothetical protein